MSRPPRFSYARAVHHVTLRCNNREFLFSVPSFELYLDILQKARARFPLRLYNFCLMTNHVHLLCKVGRGDTLSAAMHWISSTFARRFNRLTSRWGHLWEGRFRSTIIEENSYFFRCMAYLDLNPVRAKMAVTPLEYRWCGHRALRDEDTAALDLHPLYLDCGTDAAARYRSYMNFLADEATRPPASSLATKYFVGTPHFVWRMEKRFGWAESKDRLAAETRIGDDMSDVICVGPKIGRTRPHN
ncbi:MAG: transposase [Planctomycetota bacterium]